MKRLLCLILGLLAAQCEASMIPLLAGSPPNPILFQDALTYANAAAAASAGWTNAGTVNWGDTSGPGSFSGTAALLSTATASNNTLSPTIVGHTGGTVYFYLKEFAVATNTNQQDSINFRTADSATSLFIVQARSAATAALRVEDSGGSNASLNNAYALNTVYPLKVRYTPGTGSNDAIITVWTSTDGTTWTQQVNRTNGSATGLLGRVRFAATTSSSTYARNLYVSTMDYTVAQLLALP